MASNATAKRNCEINNGDDVSSHVSSSDDSFTYDWSDDEDEVASDDALTSYKYHLKIRRTKAMEPWMTTRCYHVSRTTTLWNIW